MAEKKSDYLNPKWQKKRLEILDRDNFTCQVCNNKEETLHVHHRYYTKGAKVWEYMNSCFMTLCENCHKEHHDSLEKSKLFGSDRLMWISSLMDCLTFSDDEDVIIEEIGKYPRAIIFSGFGGKEFPHYAFSQYNIFIEHDFIDVLEMALYNNIPWSKFSYFVKYLAKTTEFKTLEFIDEKIKLTTKDDK